MPPTCSSAVAKVCEADLLSDHLALLVKVRA
jgi:hypothetical protein